MKVLYVYNKPYSTGAKMCGTCSCRIKCNERNILSGHLYCMVTWVSAFIGVLLLESDTVTHAWVVNTSYSFVHQMVRPVREG